MSLDPRALTPECRAAGERMHRWLRDLFPICRSLTGPGVRQTLDYLGDRLPGLVRHGIESGTKVFDWTVPPEWTIRSATLLGPDGATVADLRDHTLHVMGYSRPVDLELDLEELQPHLHSLPEQPDAIPFVTSYYREAWGFCLAHRRRESLPPGRYRARIDSTLGPGRLDYADLLIPGEGAGEVLLSTYVCHPSMANNELSGPVLATALGQWLATLPRRRLTYRIVFVPETIGSIVYLSRNLEHLRRTLVAGFVLTCVGDERAVSMVESPYGDTLADRVARHVLRRLAPGAVVHPFTERGSDERQYCSPGVRLPVCSVMRSKHSTYPEYHTSLDDDRLVTPVGLAGSFAIYRAMIEALEANCVPEATAPCEPQLGPRGLYPSTSVKGSTAGVKLQSNVLAYCDGTNDLLAIADRLGAAIGDCRAIVDRLLAAGLLRLRDGPAPRRGESVPGGDAASRTVL